MLCFTVIINRDWGLQAAKRTQITIFIQVWNKIRENIWWQHIHFLWYQKFFTSNINSLHHFQHTFLLSFLKGKSCFLLQWVCNRRLLNPAHKDHIWSCVLLSASLKPSGAQTYFILKEPSHINLCKLTCRLSRCRASPKQQQCMRKSIPQ